MNNKRRSKIREAIRFIELGKDILQRILDEEQDTLDNMPENLQCSIRAMDSEDSVNSLDDSISSIENAIALLSEGIDSANEVPGV